MNCEIQIYRVSDTLSPFQATGSDKDGSGAPPGAVQETHLAAWCGTSMAELLGNYGYLWLSMVVTSF